MKKHITFTNIVLFLVVIIAGLAFALSFKTISNLGGAFFPRQGQIFAIMVDVAMVVLGLVRVQAGRTQNAPVKRAALIGLVTAGLASFIMNVVTPQGAFPHGWLHYVVHGLPPVALLSLSELALTMYDAGHDKPDDPLAKLMARAIHAVAKTRRQLHAARHVTRQLRQELATTTVALANAQLENDTLRQIVGKADESGKDNLAALKATRAELAAAKKELTTLQTQLATDYIRLDTLHPRLGYVVSQVANGRIPNGDFAEKFGVGTTSVDRAMSVIFPKEDR